MQKITYEQVTAYIVEYVQKTANVPGLTFRSVSHFITPEVDLYMLTLLSKAVDQGLDVAFVDSEKLQTGNYEAFIDSNIDLSSLLFTGYHFTYVNDSYSGFGDDIIMDTLQLHDSIIARFNLGAKINTSTSNLITIADITHLLNSSPPKRYLVSLLRWRRWRWHLASAFVICLAFEIGILQAIEGIALWFMIWVIYITIKSLIKRN